MARFVFDPGRLNSTVEQRGKEYNLRLIQRGQTIFRTLLGGLGSTYLSSVQGPNYTLALKAMALELARLELALEDIDRDRVRPRSDFLWTTIGYLVLVNKKAPELGFSDEQFRQFFAQLIQIYFEGSVPDAIQRLVSLFLSSGITVTEDFKLVREGSNNLDISDQFTFGIDYLVPPGQGLPADALEKEALLRQLLDLIRPGHTLFKLRFIFSETPVDPGSGGSTGGGEVFPPIADSVSWQSASYYYDDTRSYWRGFRGRDRLGRRGVERVVAEKHGTDF